MKLKQVSFFLTAIIFLITATIIISFYSGSAEFDHNFSNGEISKNCNIRLTDVLDSLDNNKKDYLIKYEFINIFPEYENLQCLGKVGKIEDRGESFLVIHTYINNLLKNILFFLIPGFLFLLSYALRFNKKRLNSLLVCSLLISIFINLYLGLPVMDVKLTSLYVLLFYVINKVEENKDFIEKILKFYLFILLVTYSSDFSNVLFDNEYGYIGEVFASNNEFSSYISSYNNSFVWRYLLISLEQIFASFYINVLRLVILLLTFITLLRIFRVFKISLIAGVFSIFIFLSINQALVGGDIMFGRNENRTLAYIFLLNSFIFIKENKLLLAYLAFTFTFLSHFAVAIVNFPVFLFILFSKNDLKRIITNGLPFFLITLPFGLTIYKNGNSNNLYNIQYYIQERSPHHLYPFDKESNLILNFSTHEWSDGFFKLLAVFIVVAILGKLISKNFAQQLSIFTGCICLFYFLVNYFFPLSKFVLLHPYRIVSLFTLFSIFYLMNLLIDTKMYTRLLSYKLLIPLIILFSINLFIKDDLKYYYSNLSEYSGVHAKNYVIKQQPKVFITPTTTYGSYWAGFEYQTKIPTYAIEKFTPNNLNGMALYLKRIEEIDNFYSGECKSLSKLGEFLFVDKDRNNLCGSLVYKEENFNIYSYP